MDEDFKIRNYKPDDREAVIEVWDKCRLLSPQNDPVKDIQKKMEFQPELFFICELNDKIVGTVMAGYDGHRGWINYLGILPEFQKRGAGSLLLNYAVDKLKGLGCPKVNLQVRDTNLGVTDFYIKNGFKFDQVKSMGRRLE